MQIDHKNPDGNIVKVEVGENVEIGDRVEIGDGVEIGNWVKIGDEVKIGYVVEIGYGVEIGDRVEIGDGVEIGNWVKIGDGVKIGDEVKIGDRVKIGEKVVIPQNRSLFTFYHKYVVNEYATNMLRIGCEIHSFQEWREQMDKILERNGESKENGPKILTFISICEMLQKEFPLA